MTLRSSKNMATLGFGLAIVLSLIILFRPGGDGPLPFWQADKVIHAGTFALLALTAWLRFAKDRVLKPVQDQVFNQPTNKIALSLLVYAVASEVIQHFFIPGREFELWDIAADLAGTLVILIFLERMDSKSGSGIHSL